MSKWNGLYLITLAVFVAACSDAEQQLAPLEEEYGIELHYHEDNPYPEPLPELEHEQVEAMLMQVSAYMQEDEADYRVDHALLQAEEVALSINLASVIQMTKCSERLQDRSVCQVSMKQIGMH
ncbi:hypothetical protein JCM19037_2647 [Geomicrobium sp. JCM 19037]|uniref:hypothetical protein n=1 Tax=Geomicrobium sp. JCM 19037 TaxID=1460634 RepID=UPI00045F4948|nr:hypothetical protein [Geomicrobium sp. JCM 19037]GAK04258.1 hypothetical protein JCM19037_2647 [Geomicrobium sp. JCM 19037]